MPLPMPNLDDRRWDDLVAEGRAKILRHAPEWTDHNASDPGITLLELLAWLVEADVYRINRITDRQRRKVLALLGITPQPPSPARVLLTFASRSGTRLRLPHGTVLTARRPDDGADVPFRLARDVDVTNLAAAAVQVSAPSSAVPQNLADRTDDLRSGRPVAAFGADPLGGPDGPAVLVGFEPRAAVTPGSVLTLALLLDAAASPQTAREDMRRAGVDPAVHHEIRTAWEWFDGGAWVMFGDGQVDDDTRGLTLSGTVRFTLPPGWPAVRLGSVPAPCLWLRCRLARGRPDAAPRLRLVAADTAGAEQAVAAWSAFRVAPGVQLPDGPPVVGRVGPADIWLDDSGRVVSFRQPAAGEPPCTVLGWRPPAGRADGELRLTLVDLGPLHGDPQESLGIPDPPVLPQTLTLTTLDPVSGAVPVRAWDQVPDFDAVGRARAACTVDAQAGVVTLGDGNHGRAADPGSRAWASADITAGAAGTPAATAAWRLAADDPRNPAVLGAGTDLGALGSDLSVTLVPGAVTPGADAGGLNEAEGAAAGAIWTHERLLEIATGTPASLDQLPAELVLSRAAPPRACTAVDFERLALAVPGTAVARARAWAGLDLGHPCLSAPGTVTVVIVPSLPLGRPQPSAGLLRAVRRYLMARRTLGTRLFVVGPQYLEVSVSIRVQTRRGADGARVGAVVQGRLEQFLDPLHGGPLGLGWPFGRDVQRSELLQQVDEVDGVDHVVSLTVSGSRPGCPDQAGGCGGVTVAPTMLVTSGRHRVEVA
jgi:hypothetical protein